MFFRKKTPPLPRLNNIKLWAWPFFRLILCLLTAQCPK